MINILFEGFLYENHSYSLSNYFLLKQLLKMDNLNVYVKRIPFFKETQFFEEKLDYKEYNGEKVDLVYRSAYPINTKTNGMKTVVFVTCETDISQIEFDREPKEFEKDSNLYFVTPSQKSKMNLCKNNKKLMDKTFVIPHGIDTDFFKKINTFEFDTYTFLNISAGSQNKNVNFIVDTFKEFKKRYSANARLVLKLNSDIYKDTISKYLDNDIIVITKNYSCTDMNYLYNSCNCYVSAGIYEGFDLPVLEAACVGLSIIAPDQSPQNSFVPKENQIKCIQTKHIMSISKESIYTLSFESAIQKYKDAYDGKLKKCEVSRQHDIKNISFQLVDYFFKKIILKQKNEKHFEY